MHRIPVILRAAAVGLGLLLAPVVGADPLDTCGLTPRARAMGGAAAATSGSVAAVLYNPGAMTAGEGPTLAAGAFILVGRLDPTGANGSLRPHAFYEVGIASPIPLGDGAWRRRIHLGLALLLPHDHIYDFDLPAASDPAWIGLGSSTRRLVLGASLGVRILEGLSLGVGMTLLPVVTGRVDLDLTDPEGDDDVRVDVDPRFRPLAGILWEPVKGWRLGLAFRMGNHASIDLPVKVDASGIDLSARVWGPAEWTPSVLSLGAELPVLPERLTLAAQLDWRMTGAFRQISTDVALYAPDGSDGLGARVPAARCRDSAAARLGIEGRVGRVELRGGYAFVSRAAPLQDGPTNLLDAHRHHVSLGGGVELLRRSPSAPRLALSVDAQALLLHDAVTEKTVWVPGNPGFPTLRSGGQVWVAGVGLEVGW